jgi:hypothetical protein
MNFYELLPKKKNKRLSHGQLIDLSGKSFNPTNGYMWFMTYVYEKHPIGME